MVERFVYTEKVKGSSPLLLNFLQIYKMLNFLIIGLSSVLLGCLIFIIFISNPIHSILLLILTFILGSIFLFIINMNFFAISFLIVYIGAIVVLFLFIIMMLDIKAINTTQSLKNFIISYDFFLIIFILFEIFYLLNYNSHYNESLNFLEDNNILFDWNIQIDYSKFLYQVTHLNAIGIALFTSYQVSFMLASFLLFIAMIGAIVLTIEERVYKTVKSQYPYKQSLKNSNNSVYILTDLK